ncbi:MAG: hypothetical protein UX13_C0050G0006 [Candidatus Woesebacteria bacterium GW2011_GWB1_45_5]|uniref:PT repeat-containing protein n=1 Tax=Candidatus Woesebacteria bacterium GW2011_GWB1_45_5 TaxID=1618581 RepID=A0A0G1ML44_9BACT|nr:MAG: hypothetical protein UX13_C0050G0006 [Candidatus Woesebacteria bacterium GW2011_GWB1_45_5]
MKININDLKGFLNSKKFTVVASFVGLFLISVGLSLLIFYLVTPRKTGVISETKRARLNLDLPKNKECPINGQMYTKSEEDVWNTKRPITAVIENHEEARPESGLSRADVIYEAVAEGGITRFLAVFYCGVPAENVKAAPVRSARIYFVNLAAGYGTDPIFLHQGGANDFCSTCPRGVKSKSEIHPTVNAYAALDKLGWRNGQHGNDMDGGFNVGFPVVVRDQYRLSSNPAAWEHSVVADLDEVYKEADKRGFKFEDEEGTAWTEGFRAWLFQDDGASSSPTATNVKFNFWDSMAGYDVEWKYDSATNSYKRVNGGKDHTDWEFDKPQLTAKNVVVMLAKETGPLDSEHHMFYQVTGTGKALIFQNGEVIEGTWSKDSQLDREVFYDTTGEEIKMVRGVTWVEVVPAQNTVSY